MPRDYFDNDCTDTPANDRRRGAGDDHSFNDQYDYGVMPAAFEAAMEDESKEPKNAP